ncbi:MAG TPA: ATP synthase subunit I [Arenicellales bacterium]|nr:ATP synthase subunit I [Arenicellales bacterium]
MTELMRLAVVFAAGGALAGLWLAGLWLDVRSLARERRPYLRLICGALVRLSVVAAGFYLVLAAGGDWTHPVAALAGFLAVRYGVLSRVRRRYGASTPKTGGTV